MTPDGCVTPPQCGVGIGYRSPIGKDILRHLNEIDFVEVVPDTFFRNLKGLQALSSLVPCIPHSLNLSIGSNVDESYLGKVKQIVELVSPPWHTDHLAFTSAGGISIGHLAPVSFTEESLDICVRNIRKVQETIDIPFAVETISMPFYWPNNTMEEHEFIQEVVKQTGCHILLDLENVRINATNHAKASRGFIDNLPLEKVVQVHLAGGSGYQGKEHDTHDGPISRETWSLLEYLFDLTEPRGVLIERDANFPPFQDLLEEIRQARNIVKGCVA